ncbi:hypothetical protein AMECASPLE_010951 [Ameca splendens]|uniref:Uncharacterized protein n=1 Tax=Ameca splendens TaxID=208324 RepID=A0ABV0ZKN7_9TELE
MLLVFSNSSDLRSVLVSSPQTSPWNDTTASPDNNVMRRKIKKLSIKKRKRKKKSIILFNGEQLNEGYFSESLTSYSISFYMLNRCQRFACFFFSFYVFFLFVSSALLL